MTYMSTALHDVAAERERQILKEGWTPQHDDSHHADGALALAAASYATHQFRLWPMQVPAIWPWDLSWWKPTTPRRDLVKASALLLAAIEQIDRQEAVAMKALVKSTPPSECTS